MSVAKWILVGALIVLALLIGAIIFFYAYASATPGQLSLDTVRQLGQMLAVRR